MILQELKQKIKLCDKKELSKKVGYKSYKNFEVALDKFFQSKSLYEWLKSGHYDFTNTSKEFFLNLCYHLELKEDRIKEALQEAQNYKKEIEKFKNNYIYVNTNFKRKSEPIFALAFCQNLRYISLYNKKEYLFKTRDEILKIVTQKIKKHYKANKNGLGIWGKIASYELHLFDKIYVFDITGKIVNHK